MATAWERKSQALITNSSKSKTRTTHRASPEEPWGPRRAERASVSTGFTTSQSRDLGKSDGHSEPQLPLFSSGRAKLGLYENVCTCCPAAKYLHSFRGFMRTRWFVKTRWNLLGIRDCPGRYNSEKAAKSYTLVHFHEKVLENAYNKVQG